MKRPGLLIREARKRAGLTQSELARLAAVGQSTVARLESPASNPTCGTLDRMLRACGHQLELQALVAPAPVDETQIAASLRLTPAERLARHTASYRNLRDLALAGRAARGELD